MIPSRSRNFGHVPKEPVYHPPVAVAKGSLVKPDKAGPPVHGTIITFPPDAKVHGTPGNSYLSVPAGYILRMFRSRTEDPTRPWDEYRIVKQ